MYGERTIEDLKNGFSEGVLWSDMTLLPEFKTCADTVHTVHTLCTLHTLHTIPCSAPVIRLHTCNSSMDSSSAFTTPPSRREGIKHSSSSLNAQSKRKAALRELGRQQRHAILQQHRCGLSPVDLQGKLREGTMAAIRAQLTQPEDDGGVLTEADIDALLSDIEQQVIAEIQAELAELERLEQEQQQHAASMVEQHMQLHNGANGASSVLCPVCKSAQLVQRQGLLVCPAEGWGLNLSAEGLSMDAIRTRLAAAYEEHAATKCTGQLSFQIENLFGSESLTCSCGMCNSLAVVV